MMEGGGSVPVPPRQQLAPTINNSGVAAEKIEER